MVVDFSKIIGKKLKDARDKLGLTLQEVSSQVGFNNYQVLSNIEDGTRQLKASELAKLAKIYLRDISFFLNSKESVVQDTVVLWRNRPKDICKIREQEFLKYCYNYYELQKRQGLNYKFTLPQLEKNSIENFSFDKIKEVAVEYSNLIQLGSRPACVLEKILEEKYNIKIVYLNLGIDGSAASAVGPFGAAILLNSQETSWRRNYNLAHELFHIVTWKIIDYSNAHMDCEEKKPVEKMADAFASYLLLPHDEVEREYRSKIKDGKLLLLDLIGIAREFEVSTEALLWRLVHMSILKENDVKSIISLSWFKDQDKIQRSKDKKQFPAHISTRYINLSFKAYQAGLISRGKFAEYLNVNRSQLKTILLEYGFDEESESYDGQLAVI